jgi:unsaturated rhamnogalacturonyl hydrolase
MVRSTFILLGMLLFSVVYGQSNKSQPYSVQMSQHAMRLWPDSFSVVPGNKARWSYDQGVILKGVEAVWRQTGDGDYFRYIQHSMDYYVREDGTIHDYKPDEFNIDHINNGKLLVLLYEVTGKEKYKKAIQRLRGQLQQHPRTSAGGFWHKKIYPWQMWLDGLYMGQPFYAAYARVMGEDSIFQDVTRQFVLMEQYARDAQTGLLYHGWDEKREQKWANANTGRSPHVWGRAVGWYGMAMVDALEHFPANHPGKAPIIAILQRYAQMVSAYQDPKSGCWYDIIDLPNRTGNYLEASASCMITYTLQKGMRMGWLPTKYSVSVAKAWTGIQQQFVRYSNANEIELHGTVSVSGLGGKPYRDGSFEYYMSEKVVVDDPKGMGAFINCAAEMELAQLPKKGKGKLVLLDRYYNAEQKKLTHQKLDFWHYTWEAQNDPGFYQLGYFFQMAGASIASLDQAPTSAVLNQAAVYIVVDPDHVKDNPHPNFMNEKEATVIANWVKQGGTLLLLANDSANCDLQHINILAGKFGVQFSNRSVNMVKQEQLDTGWVINQTNLVFRQSWNLYLKEVSALTVNKPAQIIAEKNGNVVMAAAKFGKGKVLIVGDPWIYNEYVDGRRLPKRFQNAEAIKEVIQWIFNAQ